MSSPGKTTKFSAQLGEDFFSSCSPMAARTVAGSRQNAGSLTASSDAEEDELSCASTSDLHQLGSSASRRLDGFLVQRAQERVFATACDTAARIEKADVASDDCFDSPSHWGCCELEKECTEFARSSPACSLLMMHSPPRGRKLMLGLDEDECNESSNTGTVPSTCTWQPFSPIMPYDTNGHARRTACSRAHHSERVIDAVGMDACNRRLGTDQPSPSPQVSHRRAGFFPEAACGGLLSADDATVHRRALGETVALWLQNHVSKPRLQGSSTNHLFHSTSTTCTHPETTTTHTKSLFPLINWSH